MNARHGDERKEAAASDHQIELAPHHDLLSTACYAPRAYAEVRARWLARSTLAWPLLDVKHFGTLRSGSAVAERGPGSEVNTCSRTPAWCDRYDVICSTRLIASGRRLSLMLLDLWERQRIGIPI